MKRGDRSLFARRRQRVISRSVDRARKKLRGRTGYKPGLIFGVQYNGRSLRFPAPNNFSFIQNHEELIPFFESLRPTMRKGFGISLEMSKLKSLTNDGIAFLLSKIKNPDYTYGMPFGGTDPEDPSLEEILAQSGFYGHVHTRKKHRTGHAIMVVENQRKVMTNIADAMSEFASRECLGDARSLYAIYDVCIECMANTKNHATVVGLAKEPWTISAHHEPLTNTVHFSFIDYGQGIIGSLKRDTAYRKKYIDGLNSFDILERLLNGKLPSRTLIEGRGKGLPAIYEWYDMKRISGLKFITNDLFADFDGQDFHTLKYPFKGTFVSWSFSPANVITSNSDGEYQDLGS